MSSGRHVVTSLSVVGAAVVILGALGIASTLQVWYQRVFDQPPARNMARQVADRLLWLGGLVLYLTVQDFSFIHLNHFGGARVPIYAATFILAVAFTGGPRTCCCWAGCPGAGSSPPPSPPPGA
jgi:hypothetical protein